MRLTDASAVHLGATAVSAVYLGATAAYAPDGGAVEPLLVQAATSGAGATVALPTYTDGDYLLLTVARNQAETVAFGVTGGTLTEIENVQTRRLLLARANPGQGVTSLTLSSVTAAVWSWSCLNLGAAAPAQIVRSVGTTGSNTTSTIELAAAAVPAASGNELALAVAATNSTAVWTSPPGLTSRAALTGAPGLLVGSTALTQGVTSFAPGDADRGNAGTTRFECALTVVLRP